MLFRQGSFCYSAFIKIGVLNDKRIKKTPLYETYVNSGAKIVEFGGWAMPVQFTSIKEEHNAVRYKVGMFDVSHMGEILIEGENASKFVQYLLSNDTTKLSETKAQYTALCNDEGGIIDDLVTYKIADNKYLLIVNAANTDKDFEWIQKHQSKFNATVTNVSEQYGQLAVQGPQARTLVSELVDIDVSEMKPFEFKQNVTIFGKMLSYLNLDIQVKMVLKFIVIQMIQLTFGMVLLIKALYLVV